MNAAKKSASKRSVKNDVKAPSNGADRVIGAGTGQCDSCGRVNVQEVVRDGAVFQDCSECGRTWRMSAA
jgi:hypothetical protein